MQAVAGTIFRSQPLQKQPVARTYCHERYNERTLDNDYGVMELAFPFVFQGFEDFIFPINLVDPNEMQFQPGTPYEVSGWGYWKADEIGLRLQEYPENIQWSAMFAVDRVACGKKWPSHGVTPRMNCAEMESM